MAARAWPWADLPLQAAVVERLESLVQRSPRWRWLEVSCSLAAGRGDELSDVDAGIGYGGELHVSDLDAAGLAVVAEVGHATDVLLQVMPGWPIDIRRLAVEFEEGVQLDLVIMPSERRVGLPTGAVAVVDKDGRLESPWTPPVEDVPTPDVAREWLMLGWWALSDVAKYLRRESVFEAVERLVEARQQALRLYAVGERTPFPSFGLVSLLDFPPYRLPERLGATYSLPRQRGEVLRAALATADLLEDAGRDAAQTLGSVLSTPWADAARLRLAAVAQ
ncbi:MAG: hypothetical protein ACT4PW_01970 [Acidimicrobiia bacterium]